MGIIHLLFDTLIHLGNSEHFVKVNLPSSPVKWEKLVAQKETVGKHSCVSSRGHKWSSFPPWLQRNEVITHFTSLFLYLEGEGSSTALCAMHSSEK